MRLQGAVEQHQVHVDAYLDVVVVCLAAWGRRQGENTHGRDVGCRRPPREYTKLNGMDRFGTTRDNVNIGTDMLPSTATWWLPFVEREDRDASLLAGSESFIIN